MQRLLFDFNHTKNGSYTVMRIVLLLCMVWFITVLLAALSGGFEMAVGEPSAAILFAVIAPVVMFGVSFMTISAFRDWVLILDMRQLILLHSWRMVGVGFVFLYFHGQLPALFALPADIGDAVAAAGALFLDIALFKNASAVSRRKVFYGIPFVCWILLLLFLWVWQPAPMSGYPLQTWPAATSWTNFH